VSSRPGKSVAAAPVPGDPFEALGDPHRRKILSLLGHGDMSVQEIATALPISRPAVSRHLRLLKRARLVAEEPQGTRRIYHLQEQGMQAVQAYLGEVWGAAASRFRLVAENTEGKIGGMIEPLRLSFHVACSVEHAFSVWTSGIGTWWPTDHTVAGLADLFVVLEGGTGGRIYERSPDGVEHDWGEVTVWEPPTRLGYLWHPRRDRADATEVEITFVEHGDVATRIEIEHRGWERLGADGDAWRTRNRGGWQSLLPHYLTAIGNGES
jgi:DNA-binding transcriptional ArsR family regulator